MEKRQGATKYWLLLLIPILFSAPLLAQSTIQYNGANVGPGGTFNFVCPGPNCRGVAQLQYGGANIGTFSTVNVASGGGTPGPAGPTGATGGTGPTGATGAT